MRIDLPGRDFETGDETAKGSHNRYKYGPACRSLRLSSVFREGLSFPYDFGFFLSTQSEDSDPLDVLLFIDHGVPPCTVVTARLLGVLVASYAHHHGLLKALCDRACCDEIEAFFGHYAGLDGRQLEVLTRKGPRRAHKLLEGGARKVERSR
jgi:inorganic pyrophosphatase